MLDHPILTTIVNIGLIGFFTIVRCVMIAWESYVMWRVWGDLGFPALTFFQILGINVVYSIAAGTRASLKREDDTWKQFIQLGEAVVAPGIIWIAWEILKWWFR